MLPLPPMLHILCLFTRPTRDKLHMVFFPCWCTTGSSFPAILQQGLLSLLVHNWVFFPGYFATGSSFPAGTQQGLLPSCFATEFPCWCKLQISYFKILPRQQNKMATGHKPHKLGRQSLNNHNCQLWFTSLHIL